MKLQNKTIATILEIATHIGFCIWAVMACFFFQERLYGDEGFFIAKVVHYETFWVELNRYARVFSQWLPLLAIKAKFSMHTVLILFSLCQVLFFYAIFLWARYRQSNHQAGWMLLAMNTIGIAYCFSTQGFELYYCAALLMVLYLLLPPNANYLHDASHSKNTIALVGLTGFIILNYQLAILPLLGILLLHASEHKTAFWKTYLVILVSAVFTIIFKKIFFVYSYETEKANFFIQNLLNWAYDGQFFKELGFFLWKFYFELILIQIITIFVYTKQKKWILLCGYLVFVLLALLMAILTFPSLSRTQYQEQCYFILIFVTCFPLIMNIMTKLEGLLKLGAHLALFLLILYRFLVINDAMLIFSQRVAFMHRLINHAQTLEGNKFILNEKNAETIIVHPYFTFAMETMLLSAINPQQKTVSIVLDTYIGYGDNSKKIQDENWFISTIRSYYDRPDSLLLHQSVNQKYFDFPAGKYRLLNGAVPLNDRLDLLKQYLKIEIINTQYPITETSTLPILIKNESPVAFNSNQIRIGYKWWKNGLVVPMEWEGFLNPIEVDIMPSRSYQQPIRIHTPSEKGFYELEIVVYLLQKEKKETISSIKANLVVE